MTVEIVPITQEHIEGFHRALDFVARERRYLAFLEAPPPDETRAFVLHNIAQGYPQLVVSSAGEVVGWCDIVPKSRPVHAHVGVLGVALYRKIGFEAEGLMRDAIKVDDASENVVVMALLFA
jgi:L-amino acid N-acyltransferase YncA